jgi:hypothetical protein
MISEVIPTEAWLALGRMMHNNGHKSEDKVENYVTTSQKTYTIYMRSKYGDNWLYKVKDTDDDRAFLRKMRHIMLQDLEETRLQKEQQEEARLEQMEREFIEEFNDFIQEEQKMERQLQDRVICPQAFREWQYHHMEEYKRFAHLL